jgi:homeobox-leucine zipper protein
MELAQQMMATFYSAVSGPVTQPSSSIAEWHDSNSTCAERIDAVVRMVTWKKVGSMDGEPSGMVLSASTTVWLPSMLPQLLFQYLCNGQRRGEWDTFANGAAVEELGSVATGHLDGNVVSVLFPKVSTPF